MSFGVDAQYWFGPKVGFHHANFKFDDPQYESVLYDVNSSFGYQFGGVLVYEATSMYSIQTELLYKRVFKKVENDLATFAKSNSTYNYLTIPLLLRLSFGREPVHYFIGGGPELNFWIGGKGDLKIDEFSEGPTGVLDETDGFYKKNYTLTFTESKRTETRWTPYSPNVLQYSLTAVAGVYLDLRSNARILIEGRYMWGHSNLGFNNPDVDDFVDDFSNQEYTENFEHRINMASISIAYLFHYDSKEATKGMSNMPESKRAEIKAKKKQKKSE
jgi:hypothetical protein